MTSQTTPPRECISIKKTSVLCLTLALTFATGTAQTVAPSKPTKLERPEDASNVSPQDQAVELSPFQVQASSEEDGYLTRSSASSSRIVQKYVDTAQTISVLNSQYISDWNIQDGYKLFERMPNVYQSTPDTLRVWVRGTQVGRMYVDGVLSSPRNQLPLQFYDRVEIVSGPSSAAFGIGQPGGIINFTLKAPVGRERTTMEVGVGEYSNRLVNLDNEGKVATRWGKIDYRLVGYYEEGNYFVRGINHRGAGALLSLATQLDKTTWLRADIQFSQAESPDSDINTLCFANPVSYSWLMGLFGSAGNPNYPALPNSKPYPGPEAAKNGFWAGGDLISQRNLGYPPGWGGRKTNNLRGSFTVEKSFLDKALTIKNTVTHESGSVYSQYVTGDAFGYVNPATGQPFNDPRRYASYPNNAYGTLENFGVYIGRAVQQDVPSTRYIAENLDLTYKREMLGGKWRFNAGGNINETLVTSQARTYYPKNPDGSDIWVRVADTNPKQRIDIGTDKTPRPLSRYDRQLDYAWGGYVNIAASYLDDRVVVEVGDRRDVGGSTNMNYLSAKKTSTGQQRSLGAPRQSIVVKPLKWLSVYALRANHDDPTTLVAKYVKLVPGPREDLLNQKYNNFSELITLAPSGLLKEVGVKAELLGGDLVVSADVFRFTSGGGLTTSVRESQISPPSPIYGAIVVQNLIASNNASGGEVSVAGKIGRNLTVNAAYGITRGLYAPFPDGNPNYIRPPSTTAIHLKYDFKPSGRDMSFFVMAGGTRWGPYLNWQNPYVFYPKAQYVWDGGFGVRWGRGRHSLSFTANNIEKKMPNVSANTSYSSQSFPQTFLKYKVTY